MEHLNTQAMSAESVDNARREIERLRSELKETRARAAHAESEAMRVRSQFAHLPLASMWLTPALEVERWSPFAETLFGWSQEEVEGKGLDSLSLVDSEALDQFAQVIARLRTNEVGEILTVEGNYSRTGQVLSCEWYFSPNPHPDGSLASVLVVVRDITDIAQIHASLSEAHTHYRRLFEEAQRSLYEVQILYRTGLELIEARTTKALLEAVIGGGRRVSQADRAVGALLNPEDGSDYLFLACDSEEEYELTSEETTALTDIVDSTDEIDFLSHRGPDTELLEISIPFHYRGRTLGALIVSRANGARPFSDRERKLVRTLVNQASVAAINLFYTVRMKNQADQLKESNDELEQFAYIASHDLQEPLRMISNFSKLLTTKLGESLQPEGLEYLSYIVDGSQRMQRLIDDLLTFSRVGTAAQNLDEVDSEIPLLEAIFNLQAKIKGEGAQITYDELPVVLADSGQLSQLFLNLLANGIKFHDEQTPQIHISATPEGQTWIFRIRDNGIGIESRFHQRIFEAFSRLHTQEEYPGTGIGLAICKKIVERHGGTIWIEPNPTGGSVFCFRLRDGTSTRSLQNTGRLK